MNITVTPGKVRKLLAALTETTIGEQVRGDQLTPDQIKELAELFKPWEVGEALEVGSLREYQGNLYEVVQAHTTQADWTPPEVPALFTAKSAPGVIPAWVQPTGAQDAYAIGDRVTHDNPNDGGNIWLYESKIDANTTEPGRDDTFDRYWEPVEVA